MIRYMSTESFSVEVVRGEYDVTGTWLNDTTVRLDSLQEPCFWIEFDVPRITSTPREVRGRFPGGNQVDRPLCRTLSDGRIEVSSPDGHFVCMVTL